MLTPTQVKSLEEMDFERKEPRFVGWDCYWIKCYGEHGANGEIIVHESGNFNVRYHSSVSEEVQQDLAKLKEGGIE